MSLPGSRIPVSRSAGSLGWGPPPPANTRAEIPWALIRLLGDHPSALRASSRISPLLHRAGSIQQVAGAPTGSLLSSLRPSHWALGSVGSLLSFPPPLPGCHPSRKKKKNLSLKIPREYLCALRPRSGDEWPCSACVCVSSTLHV